MQDVPVGFGMRLRRFMAMHNVGRGALAHELGVDKSVVWRWLAGVNKPTDHNLARLTQFLRRYQDDLTLDYWTAGAGPSTAASTVEVHESSEMRLVGLRAGRDAHLESYYEGVWAGFYQSTQNLGSVVLCGMCMELTPAGLRTTFTEGRVVGEGSTVVIGMRAHSILQLAPRFDRLCLFVFNGIGTADAVSMEGVYCVSAGESEMVATSSPITMLRLCSMSDYQRMGGFGWLRERISNANEAAIPRSAEHGDPTAGFAGHASLTLLQRLCPLVGMARPDGAWDHVLRMPAHRALPYAGLRDRDLPPASALGETLRRLRALFGIEAAGRPAALEP